MRRIGALASMIRSKNKTCRLSRAARGRYCRRAARGVNMPPRRRRIGDSGTARGEPKRHHVRYIRDLPVSRNMWTVGRDSCAGVTPYCSFSPVGYDISCDSNYILLVLGLALTSGRGFRGRRGLRDSEHRDFCRSLTSQRHHFADRRGAKGKIR